MTQAELAKLLDIEQGAVSKIMSGARSITLDHAKRVTPFEHAAGGVLGSRLIDELFFDHPWKRSNNSLVRSLAYEEQIVRREDLSRQDSDWRNAHAGWLG